MSPTTLSTLMRKLGTANRLAIVRLLLDSDEALPMSLIAAKLSMPDGQASDNLCTLAECGILMRTQSGKHRFYTPNRAMIAELQAFFNTKP